MRMSAGVLFLSVSLTASAAGARAEQWLGAESRWASHEETKLHYRSWGRGDTALVFVHGWACDMTFFSEQIPHFSKRMRVVAVDLPGHGQSDKPERAYTQSFFAESLASVLDEAKVKRAIIVGHSMGMPVARQFYRLHPERVAAIVSLDGALKAMITNKVMIDTILASLRGSDYHVAAERMIDGMLAQTPNTPYKAHIKEVMMGTPQHVVAESAAGMFDLSLWNDDSIDVPLLMIKAPNPLWTKEYEEYVRTLAPTVDYVVVDGVSHFLQYEKPAEINSLIDAFLDKHKLVRRGRRG